MSGFKLIAIRPLKGCSKRFLKVLKENEIYKFYNDYDFKFTDNDKTKSVSSIEYNPTVPEDLYNITTTNGQDLDINISAVVGKNGSGKSSLIELLFLSTYIIGVKENILPNKDKYQTELDDEDKEYSKRKEILNEIEAKYKIEDGKNEQNIIILYLLKVESKKKKEAHEKKLTILNQKISDLDYFSKHLKVEIFYSVNENIYCLQIANGETNISLTSGSLLEEREFKIRKLIVRINKKEAFNIRKFFYSIVLNYSSYGLNSKNTGYWIQELFHKNDGYKTPIVINPMRTDGNFDINDENEFATYRLLSNLLIEKYLSNNDENVYITDNQYVKAIRFSLNRDKSIPKKITGNDSEITGEPKDANLILDLITEFFGDFEQLDIIKLKQPFKKRIYDYIVNKVEKISETYPEYEQGYKIDNESNIRKNINFLKKFKNDGSHITFKLKQAINFLRNNTKSENKQLWSSLENNSNSDAHIDFTLEDLLKWMNVKDISEIIYNIPPSIFSIDIILSDTSKIVKSNIESTFNELSSGEQQLIHSSQSVLYHLNNIQSVHYSNDDRLTYENINIIFDEIELYFHPDYQRKFINELLKAISRLNLRDSRKGIQTINILLSTHSPFVLSDIPSSNVLLLENG